MIPYSEKEWRKRILIYGTVVTLSRNQDNVVEHFILDWEELDSFKELQNDKPKL